MAGEGQRFKQAAYTIPKPMLPIDGLPMVVRAAKSLPPADRYIFVCQQKLLLEYPLENTLKQYFEDVVIVAIDGLTEGQAITCMMAVKDIPPDAALTIGASDNGMYYDAAKFSDEMNNPDIDAWIWTFKNNPAVLQNPGAYGWVETVQGTTRAKHVSCKVPLTANPLNDHAVIGAFSFRKASVFFDAVNRMVALQERVNNEFYVDMAMNSVIAMGYVVNVIEVDQYLGWGTPQDYQKYISGPGKGNIPGSGQLL